MAEEVFENLVEGGQGVHLGLPRIERGADLALARAVALALVDGLAAIQVRHLQAQVVHLVGQRAGEPEQERHQLLARIH